MKCGLFFSLGWEEMQTHLKDTHIYQELLKPEEQKGKKGLKLLEL